MDGFKHHRFGLDEMRDANWDTGSLVQQRFDAAMAAPAEPRRWNTQNKRWGGVWTTLHTAAYPYQVVAGLEGEMTGVVVAKFERNVPGPMCQFADDFSDGKVFALDNGTEWQTYVRDGDAQRKFDADTFRGLLNRGRNEGFTLDGVPVTVDDLRRQYEG